MSIIQIRNRFEKKISEFNNVMIMNDVNGKYFVQQLHKLLGLRKMKYFKYFESVAIRWLQLFFDSKTKFPPGVWIKTLQKMYTTVLHILLLDNGDLKFSLRLMMILVDSCELVNIKTFIQDLDKFVMILSVLYEQVFSSCIFHYQRLFFKLVYDLVQLLDPGTQVQLIRKIFEHKLSEQLLQIEKLQSETSLRSIINRINKNSDFFKSFAIVAKSIKVGDLIIQKPELFTELWVDFNIIVMEISFYFVNNGDVNLINIPTSCIHDIIIVNKDGTKINIALNSNWLPLESGAHFTINGINCVNITFPDGNDTKTLKDYIIPEYLKWVHENSKHTISESCETVVNMETLASDTDSRISSVESNNPTVIINDSQELAEPALTTNGVYKSFKNNVIESESQAKNIIVQRVDPLPKIDTPEIDTEIITIHNTPISTPVIPDSQGILIRRRSYRDVYSQDTQEIPLQSASQIIQINSTNKNVQCESQHVENRVDLFMIQYDTRIEDNQERAKVERINSWLNMTLRNMNRAFESYEDANNNLNAIIDLDQEEDTTEYESMLPPPPKTSRTGYFLISQKSNQDECVEQDLDILDTKFRKNVYNLIESMLHKFNNPRKDLLENKVKQLKLEQHKILTDSFEEISESLNSIQKADENIQKLHHKAINMLDRQTKRIGRYKATVSAHNAEIKELDAKTSAIIDQFKTNLIKVAGPVEKEIWNSYILNLSRNIQNNLLKNLF